MNFKPLRFKTFYEGKDLELDADEIRQDYGPANLPPRNKKKPEMGFINNADFSGITYEQYCEGLDKALAEGFLGDLASDIPTFFREVRDLIGRIAADFKIGISTLISAFKQRDVFAILKAFKFNFQIIWKSIIAFHKYEEQGLLRIFTDLHKSKIFQKIESGAMAIDDVLNKYPILKKVAGIAIAGLLFYIWLNMTFIGNADFDFDMSSMVAALHGSFSIADLFASPSGLEMLTFLVIGVATGISVPWLGEAIYNIILALAYTAIKKLSGKTPEITNFLKQARAIIK